MSIIQHLLHHAHAGIALMPGADALAGTKTGKTVQLAPLYDLCSFLVAMGAGAVGTTKFTVEACSDSSGTNAEAIPFEVSKQPSANSADTWDAITAVTAAGYDTPAAANKLHLLQVHRRDLPAGKPWVRLKAVEQVDAAMDACAIWILTGPGYPDFPPKSAY